MKDDKTLENITSLAKRRGFIYPSSEIYGGLANTYDFGPYGTELKENVRRMWWDRFVRTREDMYGIDSSIIINPAVWEASGHVAAFGDVMVEDSKNAKRYRADHIIEDYADEAKDLSDEEREELKKVDGKTADELQEIIEKYNLKSPDGNDFTKARKFNLLFETKIGIVEGDKSQAFLRGEIAQGLFINYPNIIDSMHPKLPFGIAQAGKAFRNEITKGQFTFRTLEFDLMEFEYFFDPSEDWNELFEYWKKEINAFALSVGLKEDNLRWRPHEDFELSHYSDRTEDLEYKFPWGFKEMFACAYRTDFDLKNHSENSGKDLSYRTQDGDKFIPHVIEPTFGLSRLITIMLMDAYTEETLENGKTRTVLKFAPQVAPVKAAIFPLQKDEKLQDLAREVYKDLSESYAVEYENKGNIGKMYRRHDEIGTPFCITVDFDSLEDKSVTVRDRDTMEQTRIKITELDAFIQDKLA